MLSSPNASQLPIFLSFFSFSFFSFFFFFLFFFFANCILSQYSFTSRLMVRVSCRFTNNSTGPDAPGSGSSILHLCPFGCAIFGFIFKGRCDLRLYAGEVFFQPRKMQRSGPHYLALLMPNKKAPPSLLSSSLWRCWQEGGTLTGSPDLAPGNSSNILGKESTPEGWEPNCSN